MTDIQHLEKTLWQTADKLRSNMDAAEYKHIVLGLIFLKYISDAFADLHQKLADGKGEFEGADPEDPDEYQAHHIFFVPPVARWAYIQGQAKQPKIGILLDEAMLLIEKQNPTLKDALPTNYYGKPELDKQRLGELIDLISSIGFSETGHRSRDLLGRVYEYFLGEFADAEGKKGGQFYTPASIVKLLVEMIEPLSGRVYDGCCGSGGMFVQSEKFIEGHQGRVGDISIYGQESNFTTYKLARMNLAIRGIEGHIAHGDTLLRDLHPHLKADYVLANPPFNISDWSGEQLREDVRWAYGVPPVGNANYAWLQHYLHKLSPRGVAGIVLANGSMNSNSGGEGEIRREMVRAGVVDCMVALPSQLFYNTMIPACLWFLARGRESDNKVGKATHRRRKGEVLFVDARKMGRMVNRRNRELSDEDIARIADTYHQWRNKGGKYEDVQGFCRSAKLEEVEANDWVLMPGRYVGTEEEEADEVPFAERMQELTTKLAGQFARGAELEEEIRKNLKELGFPLPKAGEGGRK